MAGFPNLTMIGRIALISERRELLGMKLKSY